MPNYRYVSQGEFYVTTDENTVLITSGMTDCIGIAFIDKTAPKNRAVAHLDGNILYDRETAFSNMNTLKQAFENQTGSTEYEVYLLGGQKNLRNYRILLPVLEDLGINITLLVDINEFCTQRSIGQSRYLKFSPFNVDATLVCPAVSIPVFMSYKPSYFDPPLSEDALADGKGLSSKEEQESYALFAQINDKALASDPSLSRVFRCSDDKDWILNHKSIIITTEPKPPF